MLAKRVIPCLDIAAGRVVKGVNFQNLRDAGDPAQVARRHADNGADELVFLDIGASPQERAITLDTVRAVAAQVFIPLTVGGGVRSAADFGALLDNGADKVAINSAALAKPALITKCARRFGSQCVVVAIDAKRANGGWTVFSHGARRAAGKDAIQWAQRAAALGAGEILLTSIDADGTLAGFDIALTRAVADAVTIPVIASGGGGRLPHLADAILKGGADAALAASIFHDDIHTPRAAKQYLRRRGIVVNLPPPSRVRASGGKAKI